MLRVGVTLYKDLLGKALFDYFCGKAGRLFVRRDDDYLNVEPLELYFSNYEKWSTLEKKLISRVKDLVLDAGCGVARHLLYLQKCGIRVIGMDVSKNAVKVCKKRGAIHVVIGAMPYIPFRNGCLNSIICMFNTLGICGGSNETLRLLKEMNRISRENALLLADLNNPVMTEKEEHLKYQELNKTKNRPLGLVRIRFEYKGEVGEWFDLYLMTPDEVKELCEKSGWRIDEILHIEQTWYGIIARKIR